MSAPIVLLVEDDATIRRFVRAALDGEGCRVFEADSLQQGVREAASRKPDLVILDLGLPDGEGLSFVTQLRTWSHIPILILSARSGEADKIQALDTGADDFLVKPFSVGELLARVRALLRRSLQGSRAEEPVVRFGDIAVDRVCRQVLRGGEPLHLTPIEYRLLCALLAHEGTVMTHRQLLREVWGPNAVESNHYLRVYVGHLRHKLEVDPTQPQHLLTETGVGYRFQR
ncbi:MAG TPA: two-component system response regulator KdpE [Aquabacterium sp.]|uniref:two-component system response regulator KdpE n=1 Tax=Aquabacterium sp. TaxID=1872578 RepID=UPI002E2F19BF|nr:two-component system response regulator KdpE [Aquabacterium sp.]HEX5371652.1 two-component system response regulator KdpE [Aquabacterium sp.]